MSKRRKKVKWGEKIGKAWVDGLASQYGYAQAQAKYLGSSLGGPLRVNVNAPLPSPASAQELARTLTPELVREYRRFSKGDNTVIFGRLPAVWIGAIVSLAVAILTAVSGPGIIVSGNLAQTIANLVTVLAPIISGFIIHNFVTPVAAPVLKAGTSVKVQGTDQSVTIAAPPGPPPSGNPPAA